MATILTVCTGNICRSPAAEVLLQHYLSDIARVTSVGTGALVGHGIPAEMLINLDSSGIESRGHAARQMNPDLIGEANLVIAMAAEHRSAIVRENPAVLRRTFLLDELAKAARASAPLEGETPAERLANVPAAVQGFRPYLAGMEVEDVPDPYRRSQDDYDASYAMIHAAVADFVNWVRG